MSGYKFLNPILKIFLCLIGIAIIGYFLFMSFNAGEPADRWTAIRLLVILGFAYLMVQSIKQLREK